LQSTLPLIAISKCTLHLPHEGARIYVPIQSGNKKISAFVDCGASLTLVQPHIAKAFPIIPNTICRLGQITDPLPDEGICILPIQIGTLKAKHPALIVSGMDYDIIIGLGFLQSLKFVIDPPNRQTTSPLAGDISFSTPRVDFWKVNNIPFSIDAAATGIPIMPISQVSVSQSQQARAMIQTKETTMIPARTRKFIPYRIVNNWEKEEML